MNFVFFIYCQEFRRLLLSPKSMNVLKWETRLKMSTRARTWRNRYFSEEKDCNSVVVYLFWRTTLCNLGRASSQELGYFTKLHFSGEELPPRTTTQQRHQSADTDSTETDASFRRGLSQQLANQLTVKCKTTIQSICLLFLKSL